MLKLLIVLSVFFQTLEAYELSITSIFQNEGPYLKEWIEYHRMVGVEHFWLYNDNSKDNWNAELLPYIMKGIVEVIDWPAESPKHHIGNQCRAAQDAIRRSSGKTKWLALIDIDEFILPLRDSTVTKCLNKHFEHASGIYVNWRHFGTGKVTLKKNESMLFRLTACSKITHPANACGKSIIRPDKAIPDLLWTIHHCMLKPNDQYVTGSGEPITFNNLDLNLDGVPHQKYLRINHYTMRDEHFFNTVRLERAKGIGIPLSLVMSQYRAFNKDQDDTIIKFIKEKHSKKYESYWKKTYIINN